MRELLNTWQAQASYLVAIQYGDVEQCAALLAAGADADQTFKINSVTRPALCLGVERGAYGLVELFLESGVAVNRRDSKGYTALHVAVEMGYTEIVDLLLRAGRADVNAADEQMVTPIHIAAKRGGALNIVSSLIAYGCDVNKQDENGKTPLSYACSSPAANKEVIRVLLENKASPCQLDSFGMTPLMYMILNDYDYETVKLLLDHGANLSLTPVHGNTAIHVLILSHNPDKWKCLKMLLKRGCDMNARNNLGQTPVQLGCQMQDIESLRILVSSNANLNVIDLLGISPLGYCITNGISALVRLLISGGAKENLSRLNLGHLPAPLQKDFKMRLSNPLSLQALARRSICAQLGPGSIDDWTVQNMSKIPYPLIPYIMYAKTD